MEIILKNNPLKIKKKEVTQAINFFAEKLMHYNLLPYLSLEIHFLKFPPKFENYYGFCDYIFPDYGNPREFIFEIERSISRRNMLRTLAHEMKHVEQYATGRLKDYVKYPGVIRWMGKKIKINEKEYMYRDTDQKYQFELEANKTEIELYREYLKYRKNRK